MNAFKAASLFHHFHAAPTPSDINEYSVFSFLQPSMIEEVTIQLPDYLSAAECVCSAMDAIACSFSEPMQFQVNLCNSK